jgi:hypothetical protein
MKKLILLAGFFCLASFLFHLNAQSINNRNWKIYVGDPLNDTLTLHIKSDSSFVTNSRGDVMIRTNCTISGDTLTIADYDSGEHSCPEAKGKYKIDLKGNSFKSTVIEDGCEGRAQLLNGATWTEAIKP